jgi:pimeloyl-ACP methyl ester carboxylesterase
VARARIFHDCHPLVRLKNWLLGVAAATLSASFAPTAWAAPQASSNATTTYHRTQIDGVGVFYREAGPKDAPTIVLLHGFPTSSRQYEALIPLLATRYHIIAPDYSGFGQSAAPEPSVFPYTFDHLAKVMDDLLERLKINRYSLYIHDYGAPVGFRMMLAHPERLDALITQTAMLTEKGWARNGPELADFGQIRRAIRRLLTPSCLSTRRCRVILRAQRIRSATIRTPG